MNTLYIRKFLLFFMLLILGVGTLLFYIIAGDKELVQIGARVMQSQENINRAEIFSSTIDKMITSHRSFTITKQQGFLENYLYHKNRAEKNIEYFRNIHKTQASSGALNNDVSIFYERILAVYENLTNVFVYNRETNNDDILTLTKIQRVDTVNADLQNLVSDYITGQYISLRENIKVLDIKKRRYLKNLLINVVIGAVILLIINAFLLRVQNKQRKTEEFLKDSEKRFRLAIEGTQDGIYDWDITNDRVFFSSRYFEMLGYEQNFQIAKFDTFSELVHPEDLPKIVDIVEQYVSQAIPEYNVEFRMKHKEGHWVWIRSRAKALFDENGNAYRMVGAHTDITHLMVKQAELEKEKQEAVVSNEAKRQFLAHMSHEIRTPLTAISGIAEILEKNKENFTEKQSKLLQTLRGSTNSLKDLISDILDFSKIESGDLELIEKPFELGEFFEKLIPLLENKAKDKGVSYNFYNNIEEHQIFYGDEKRLRQIVSSLIDNAIKFTNKGGSVEVNANNLTIKENNFLEIEVKDTGIGISPDDFDTIFDRFKQIDGSESRRYGGTGLGLSISRHLAQLMDGDIIVKSVPNEGSIFTLSIPYKNSLYEENRINSPKIAFDLDEKIRSIISKNDRALIVDDYEGNVVVIGYILDEIGLPYDVAINGKIALEKWRKNDYSILFMDVQMPEMDGYEATKTIREEEEKDNLPFTPIIGMTAHALVSDKSKCIECGMDAYLPKPIVELHLKEEIFRFLH